MALRISAALSGEGLVAGNNAKLGLEVGTVTLDRLVGQLLIERAGRLAQIVIHLNRRVNMAVQNRRGFACAAQRTANDLIDRARKATTHQVSQELLRRCCQNSQKGAN